MRIYAMLIVAGLAAGPLCACSAIDDPNIRPADALPAGPVTHAFEPVDEICPDLTPASQNGGSCPTPEQMRKAEKERVARKIFDIHAHGG